MRVVFLNTFEKPMEGGGIQSAQLSICEQQGIWSVHWLENEQARLADTDTDDDAIDNREADGSPDTWFEGTSWYSAMELRKLWEPVLRRL